MDELSLLKEYFKSDVENSKSTHVLVDVGAHHGYFSHVFAKLGWQIVAFEPEKNNRAAFNQNLANYPQVVCLANAVSDKTGERLPFYVSEEHYGIHSLKPWHKTHELAYEVETVRLDTVLKDLQISDVTLLKVDIEGADFLALKGFDWGRYHPEIVMIEFSDERTLPNFNYTHHDVVEYMQAHGYTAFVSEWDKIKEYGRQGEVGEPHHWLQCIRYPLDHDAAWGNLIFIPRGKEIQFERVLIQYLSQIRLVKTWRKTKQNLKKIPGIYLLYKYFKPN